MIPRNIYSCHLALTGSIYTHTRTRLALTLTIYTPYLTIANIHLFFRFLCLHSSYCTPPISMIY